MIIAEHVAGSNSRVRVANGAIRLLMALAWIGLLLAGNARAATELKLGEASGVPGAIVFVPVTIHGEGRAIAAQFDVRFAAGAVNAESAMLAEGVSGLSVSSREREPGSRRVVVHSVLGRPMPSGVLLRVPFRILLDAAPGSVGLSVTNVLFADSEARRADLVSTSAGQLTILSATRAEFRSAQFGADGMFRLEFLAPPGRTVVLQSSSDLKSWVPVMTNAPVNGPITFSEAPARENVRFYRARLQGP